MAGQELIVLSVAEDSSGPISCRLCQEKDVQVFNIFSVDRMAEKLDHFLQVEVTTGDPWSPVICANCVSTVNSWETYYHTVRTNESKLQESQAHLYGMLQTEKPADDHNYEVLCMPKLEELPNLTSDVLIEEIVEEDVAGDQEQSREEEEQYMVMEAGDDDDGDTVVGEEEEEEGVDAEEVITEVDTGEQETARPNKFKAKTDSKRGRPKRATKPPTTLEYLTTRDEQDELIRQTLALDCDICFERSDTFEELLAHFKDVHDIGRGYVMCCQKTFKRRYVLLEHVKVHVNPDQYACPECHKRFSTKRHLNDHIVLHIPEEEREYQCEKCLKRYATSSRLTIHMRSHNEESNYQCCYCEKTFRQEAILKNHVKSVHEGSNQHICEICAKVFKTKEGFLIHQVEHLETPPERLKCEVCGGKYKNKESLKYHMLRHKRAHERYYCDVCNKEFTSKKRMSAHKKYVHATEAQLFQCTLCDKAFKRPIVLKEHMASHTGMLLYKCAFCPKQFNSNANKYSHQKAQHPTEWELARQQRLAA